MGKALFLVKWWTGSRPGMMEQVRLLCESPVGQSWEAGAELIHTLLIQGQGHPFLRGLPRQKMDMVCSREFTFSACINLPFPGSLPVCRGKHTVRQHLRCK